MNIHYVYGITGLSSYEAWVLSVAIIGFTIFGTVIVWKFLDDTFGRE